MTAKRYRNSGFTLIELLAGMTLFVLLAGTSYTALRSAAHTWDRVEEKARMAGEVGLAFDYLGRRLATAFPLAVRSGNRWRPWFEGEKDRLVFLVNGSRYVGLSGLFQVMVHHNTEARPPSVDLVLQRIDDRLGIGEFHQAALRRVLIKDIARVEFTFFGRRDSNEEPAWYPEWRGLELLPKLVRLRLQGGAVGDWPPLTVRLPVDRLQFRHTPAEGTESSLHGDRDEDIPFLAASTKKFTQ